MLRNFSLEQPGKHSQQLSCIKAIQREANSMMLAGATI